ncbi:MAG TPA: hypothetical protein VGA78_06535 [Gemmatimonadales bacterium]
MRSALWLMLCLGTGGAAAQGPINRDPAAARLVTDDIPRFWRAFEGFTGASTRRDSLSLLFERYYLEASPGLEAFVRLRIGSPFELLESIRRRPRYYAAIRDNSLKVASLEPRIRELFGRFQLAYADAVFPDVYFLIGRFNSGGTADRTALYIGTEFYSRSPDTPVEELAAWERTVTRSLDLLPCIVLHELMHFQQMPLKGRRTLLAAAFREGAPDFLAQQLCQGNINDAAHAWLRAEPGREAALWREFAAEMDNQTDPSRWLHNANNSGDRPADLGYVIGFKIAEAYYRQASNKTQALADLIRAEDPAAILAASGYRPI